jgi:peptide-methionine (R)-S-oxide reductase
VLRIGSSCLIQELYNHSEISQSDSVGFNRSRKQGFASSLCEQLTLTLIECHSEYYAERRNTRKREEFPPMGKNLDIDSVKTGNVVKSDEEWRKTLTPEEFRVTRQHGTERAFSHAYAQEKRDGMYRCVCCGAPLFNSEAKYDSGTGWPSFYAPAQGGAVSEHEDRSLFMRRTEVRCANCEAHLGHVFPDGPNPTGLRYCINGVALKHDADKSSGNSTR